jgi:CelD/BcsL family acetyltransferase involved in cellulose biosynthesis
MISAEVLPSTFPLETLRGDWDRLYGGGIWEPSLSYGWSSSMIRNHLARPQACADWFTVLLKSSSQVVGIVPMLRSEATVFGRRFTTLAPLQERNNTHSDLLIRDHDPALLGAWLDAVVEEGGAWDVLRLTRLLEEGALCRTLATQLPRGRRAFELVPQQPSYFLNLPASYEDYLAARSGKFRNYLKRAEKKLLAAGECRLEQARAEAGSEAAIGDLMGIESASWKHAHGTAISAVPHQAGFYRDLIDAAMRAGSLHLTFLRVDGQAVAHNLGVVANDCYYYLKTSFRDDCKALGVATVGRAWLIRQLIADGVKSLDFPAEPYEWEKQWTGDLRWHRSLVVYNRTANALLLRLVQRARTLLRRGAPRSVRHHNARDLAGPDA